MLSIQALIILLVVGIPSMHSSNFVLPENFLGLWVGRPDYSMLGPWSNEALFGFSISRAPNGDYLFEDNLIYDSHQITGYQRFYVEGSGDTAGSLWYCGSLRNFSNYYENAGENGLEGFKSVSVTHSSVSFCVDDSNPNVTLSPFKYSCTSCDCGNWTLSIDEDTQILTSNLIMGSSSTHVFAELKRMGPGPTIPDNFMPSHGTDFWCDFSEGGRDSAPISRANRPISKSATVADSNSKSNGGCPHLRKLSAATGSRSLAAAANEKSFVPKSPPQQQPQSNSKNLFSHCYTLNNVTDYNLAWTLDTSAELLHIQISVPVMNNHTWVGIGFRPLSRVYNDKLVSFDTGHHFNFGMSGADIVAGSVDGGIRTLYVSDYVGEPLPDQSLTITNASIENKNGRLFLKFTRPLVGGYLQTHYKTNASIVSPFADILWATGNDMKGSQSGCDYHQNKRGLRVIDWENPEIAMIETWKCA